MRRTLAASALAILVAASAAASAKSRITIRVASTEFPIVLTGSVAGAARGQRVDILAKECGRERRFRVVDDTRTTSSGFWRWENAYQPDQYNRYPFVYTPAYFRARSGRSLSSSVLVREPLFLGWRGHTPGSSPSVARIEVSSADPRIAGRVIELQRRDALGRWTTIRRTRIRRVGSRLEASFRVPLGGVTLRAYAPARTAAPCFLAAASRPWVTASARPAVAITRLSYGGAQGPRQLVLSGAVRGQGPGQTVYIYLKPCGPAKHEPPSSNFGSIPSYNGWRPVSGTRTTAGGAWRWEYPDPVVDQPVYLRAQWQSDLSEPRLVRVPLPLRARMRGRTLRVVVDTVFTGQRMHRRLVMLQRKAGARWVRVRQGRLRRAGSGRWAASFRIRQRGLTLRAFVPARSAAPCYLATATRSFKS